MLVTFYITIQIEKIYSSSDDVKLKVDTELKFPPIVGAVYSNDQEWEVIPIEISCNIESGNWMAFIEKIYYRNIYSEKQERYSQNLEEAIEEYQRQGWTMEG
jgi:hypothetical protein